MPELKGAIKLASTIKKIPSSTRNIVEYDKNQASHSFEGTSSVTAAAVRRPGFNILERFNSAV